MDLRRALAQALEQQTATAEILRVISGSPTSIDPVFDTIVRRPARLLNAHSANMLRVVGDELRLAAMTAIRATFPMPLAETGVASHVIRELQSG